MSTTAATDGPGRPGGLPVHDPWAEIKDLVRATWRDLRENPQRHLLMAAIGGAIGLLVNFAAMAVRYDGFRTPPGAAVTGQGSMLGGMVFWFLLPALVALLVGAARRNGREALLRRVRRFPETVRGAVELDGRLAGAHLLFGFGGAAVLGSLLPRGLALVSGLWIIVLLLLPWRRLLLGVVGVLWEWVLRTANVQRIGARNVSVMVALVGAAGAMAVSFLLDATLPRLALGVAAYVAGLLVARRELGSGTPTAVAAVAVTVVGVAALVLVDAGPAVADDGGWSECGQPGLFGYVVNCGGSPLVFAQSVIGGAAAFFGSLFGAGASSQGPGEGPSPLYGSGCGGGDTGGSSGPRNRKVGDHERAAEAHPDVQLYRSWRAAHPDAPIEEYWEYHERVQGVREANGEHTEPWLSRKLKEFDEYMGDVGTELHKDWESAQITDRLARMPAHVVPAVVDYLKDMSGSVGDPQQMAREMFWQKSKELIGYLEVVNHARSLPPEQRDQVYADLLGEVKENDPGYQMLEHLRGQWDRLETASLTGDNETLADIFTTGGVYLMADSALGHKMAGGTWASGTQGSFTLKSKEYFSRPGMGAASAGSRPRTKTEIVEQARAEGRPVRVRPDEYEQFGVESDVAAAVHQSTVNGDLRYVGFKDGDIRQVEARRTTPYYKYEDNKSKSYQPEIDAPLQGRSPEEMEWARNMTADFEPTVKPGPDAPKAVRDRYDRRMKEQAEYRKKVDKLEEPGAVFIDENGKRVRVPMKVDENGIFRDPDGMHAAGDIDTAYYMEGYQNKYLPEEIPPDVLRTIDNLPPGERAAVMDSLMDAVEAPTIVGYLQKISKGKIQHEGNTWQWHPDKDPTLSADEIRMRMDAKKETMDKIESEGTFHIDKDGGTYCPTPATSMGRKFGEAPETVAGAGAAAAGRESSGGDDGGGSPPGYDTQPGGGGDAGGPAGYDSGPATGGGDR